jgi:hypothetical protein
MPSPLKKQRVDCADGPGAGEDSEEDAGDESSYDEDSRGGSEGHSGEGDEDQRADSEDYGDDLEDAEDSGDEDDADEVRVRLAVGAVGPREEGCRICWLRAATAHRLALDVRRTCTRAMQVH